MTSPRECPTCGGSGEAPDEFGDEADEGAAFEADEQPAEDRPSFAEALMKSRGGDT